jgi:DNA-binding protein H-NS
VKEEWKKIGKEFKGETDPEFIYAVKKRTHKLTIDLRSMADRADQMRMANERYEKEKKMSLENKRKAEAEEMKKWEEHREERVASWRNFQKSKKRSTADTALDEGVKKKSKYVPQPIKPPKVIPGKNG